MYLIPDYEKEEEGKESQISRDEVDTTLGPSPRPAEEGRNPLHDQA